MKNIMKIPQRSKWRNAIWSRKSILGYILIWRKQNTNSKRYMQIYVHCSLKKKEILPFSPTWLDMESIMLIEISQRQTLYDFNHMWNLRNERKETWTRSVVFDSLWPHGLQPTRLLHPWDFPGKSTGVGCYFLLQGDLPDPGIKPGSPTL